jgi:NAD(P)H-flavin reductase
MVVSVQAVEPPFLPKTAKILDVKSLSEREKLFRFRMEDGSRLNHNPGQFVEISVQGVGESPISLASSPTRDGMFETAGIRMVGNVTRALHAMKPGDTVGVRGPYGNGFPVRELQGRDLLFIAGGIGIFPLRSMMQYAVDKRDQFGRLNMLYGCREPSEMLLREELPALRQSDFNILETVERCPLNEIWEGDIGVITTLFPKISVDPAKTTALVVGPPVMYRYVVSECLKKGIAKDQILLSYERRMKCGLGLCGHCQINNVYACQEGPVFTYEKLVTLPEAGL